VIEECYKCHIPFGITRNFRQARLDNGGEFFCPNGHGQIFLKTNVAKLEERLKRQKIELDLAQRAFENERKRRKDEQNSHRTTRGHVTRIKNRVAAGVCPCCNRQFQNLKRHMDG